MSRSLRHVSDGSRGGAVFDSFAILCSMLDGTGSKRPVHIAQRLIIHRRRGTHGPEMEPGGGTRGVCGGSRRHTEHKRRHAKAVVVVMPNKIPRTNVNFLPKIRKTERLCAGFTSRGPQRARQGVRRTFVPAFSSHAYIPTRKSKRAGNQVASGLRKFWCPRYDSNVRHPL